ncbi:helix-turn-helix domain-containing protein [Streptomyces sp. B1866]|uniref:PucR family transcriptional regulator n=1 Tax=Streptomyces sp. B1866 TaxID=3075431 RepID=UPI00288F8FDB|nr:helix-turn-helix domain-containing protein [Streptomyces sp. B1866]MDT3396043.1 helix-turn-helix domain-containing protein [Streptomyces sp. B1866]
MSDTALLARETFAQIPRGLSEHIRPFLDDIAEDVVREIQAHVAEYARPSDPTYMRTLYKGVAQALTLLLDRMDHPDGSSESVIETYQAIGRGEANEGRSLDVFQMALRVGARITWRKINSLADSDILPRSAVVLLGEAGLVHLDEIAAATSAGYTEARLRAAGELQRRRARLLDMLTADPPAPVDAIQDLAHAAHWTVPTSLAVIALDQLPEAETARPIVPPEFLTSYDQRPGCIVVPDPDGPGRARVIDRALHGHRAAVGPTVPVRDGARSLRWATDALNLTRRGILPDHCVVRCSEHLRTMLLFRDEELVEALADQHLGPFGQIRAPHRDRLAETLLCWLQCGRNANEVAVRLGIHPQTVRYRLRQLEELFGDCLQDPDTRFELELVLRVRHLRPQGGVADPAPPAAAQPVAAGR